MTCIDNTLTRGNKSEIVGWAIPNFESEIAVENTAGGFVYNTPEIGFLKINKNTANGNTSASLYKGSDSNGVSLNSALESNIIHNTFSGQTNSGVCYVLVKVGKNENYFFNSGNISKINLSFVPARGF